MSARALLASLAIAAGLGGCLQKPGEVSEPVVFGDDSDGQLPPKKRDAGRDSGELPRVDAAKPPRATFDGGTKPVPRGLSLITADRPPPPLSGGTLAVSSDGAIAVAADPDRDVVYVVNTELGTVDTVTLPEGSEPGRVVLDASGSAHVILRGAGSVLRIALDAPDSAKRTAVCEHPRGIAYHAAWDAIWIACADGDLVSLTATNHAIATRSFVALDLRDVLVTKTGALLVSRYRSAELLRIGADGRVVATTQPKTVSSNGGLSTMSPTLAWRTVASGEGQPLMLHTAAQTEAVVVTQGGYGGGGCSGIVKSSVTRFDEQGNAIDTALFRGAGLSVDMAPSPDGKVLAIARPGAYLHETGTLTILPVGQLFAAARPTLPDAGVALEPSALSNGLDAGVATPKAAPVRRDGGIDAGSVPLGFDCSPVPDVVPAPSRDLQVTAVAFDAAGRLFALSREPARLSVLVPSADVLSAFDEAKRIELHRRSVRDMGHDLFHADVGSGIACASCHGEALDDGHVWTFHGIGPRRTQNMRGGLSSTLPLHWEGDMMTFTQLVDEVMTRRMGGFQVEQVYADALASWIDAQPELTLTGGDAAAIARGKVLFDSAEVGCATCHAGPQLTNNTTVDVGTGGRFQVPSLLGLGLRGPYMHDGCAKTLRDRFAPACGGGDEHGMTSGLSDSQIADLVAYLTVL